MIGRSMTGGGGPSTAEVAASLPARLLGAIEELQEFSKYSEAKEEEGEEKTEISLKKGDLSHDQPDQAFIGQSAPKSRPRKRAHAAVSN